jgi:hypothetical protein
MQAFLLQDNPLGLSVNLGLESDRSKSYHLPALFLQILQKIIIVITTATSKSDILIK